MSQPSDDAAARRHLRRGACVIAPLLLAAAAIYGRIISRRRWEGREPVKGYGHAFPKRAKVRSEALKGAAAKWVPFEARAHPDGPTKLWGTTQRPYPTGAWWTNLVVGGPSSTGDGLGAAEATPYAVSVLPDRGVVLSYGDLLVANASLTLGAAADLVVTMREGFEERRVEAWDDLTMTMRLEGPKKKGSRPRIDALFARGSPYVTFRVDGATPAFSSDAMIADLYAVDAPSNASGITSCAAFPACAAASLKGDCCPQPSGVAHPCCDGHLGDQGPAEVFSVSLSNGQEWRLYFSAPVALRWDGKGAAAAAEFSGIFRAALVPPDASKKHAGRNAAMLDAHAETYATSGEVRVVTDRARDPDAGTVEFRWRVSYLRSSIERVEREPALLQLALPHHVDALVADDTVGFLEPDVLAYRGGLKGSCRGVLGAAWRVREELSKISFSAPRPVLDGSKVDALRAQLKSDVARPAGETADDAAWIAYDDWFGNAYWNGKEAARLAGLALVAEALGDAESAAAAVAQMRAILELWLTGENGDPLVYDSTYGGLCTRRGLYDHDADFGNGWYNDHHFHYGYLLYAAAVAVKNDAGFAAEHRAALFALLYDVANPGGAGATRDDAGFDRAAFPRARHKDFYAGHSWVSGIFFMGQGKAQESSSEACNAYYGAYLLAAALGDVELADWCRTLLAMEVRTAQRYYHMPEGGDVYPPRFADRNKMVGVLGALSTGAATWFGPSPAYAHGIQILPVTPATEDLLRPSSFVAEDLAFLDKVLGDDDVEDAWKAFLICERAILEPDRAWRALMALQTVDAGTSKSALLYWVATRPPPDEATKALLERAKAGSLY